MFWPSACRFSAMDRAVVSQSPTIVALVVSTCTEDRAVLQTIFGSHGWLLFETSTRAEAVRFLSACQIAIVITDADLADGSWHSLLERLPLLQQPPLLIVASYFADDRLWADALNRGAFGVLAQPFREAE